MRPIFPTAAGFAPFYESLERLVKYVTDFHVDSWLSRQRVSSDAIHIRAAAKARPRAESIARDRLAAAGTLAWR